MKKYMNFFNKEWSGVVRAFKGFFWLVTRPDFVGEVLTMNFKTSRYWTLVGYVPKERWP